VTAALAAAAFGGVLYCLGYAGVGIWPCLLVFLVSLWWALERPAMRRPLAGAAAGLAFGLAAYASGFTWLWRVTDAFLDGNRLVGALFWVGYGLWFAAGFAAYGAVFRALRRRGWSIATAGVPPLVLLEWLQPQLFPLYAGVGLVAVPLWVQTADLGGPLLLTALVAGANVVVFETVRWWRGHRPTPRAAWTVALATVVAAATYGRHRMLSLDAAAAAAPALRIGIVQANLGLLEKREQSLVSHRRHLEQTRELLAGGDVDLVVWPETAYVRGLRLPLPLAGQPIVEELRVPLLFGGSTVTEVDGRRLKSNSALLVGADGVIRDAYDKNLLIPLAEFVPFAAGSPLLMRWFPHAQNFGRSRETAALHLGPWRIATPICYEAIRPEFVRTMVRRIRPHLLVTLANDGWFGDSQEPWLHLALARLRAVEHRRFLVRSTNSGISAVVDPVGRIVARTGLLTRESLRATAHPLEGTTLYARLGDWPGWLAAVLTAIGLIRRPRRMAAEAGSSVHSGPGAFVGS
jgi:apolipoprotein N-acyltransferase